MPEWSLSPEIVEYCKNAVYKHYRLFDWSMEHVPTGENLQQWSRQLAWKAFERARSGVLAYQRFLAEQGFVDRPGQPLARRLAAIPTTDKQRYVRAFSTEERCIGGRIPGRNVIVDESSGSTGVPYNWVRSKNEVEYTRHMASSMHRYYFSSDPMFIINAFSMGAWATGVTIGAALEPNGIVKSTGPDVEEDSQHAALLWSHIPLPNHRLSSVLEVSGRFWRYTGLWLAGLSTDGHGWWRGDERTSPSISLTAF